MSSTRVISRSGRQIAASLCLFQEKIKAIRRLVTGASTVNKAKRIPNGEPSIEGIKDIIAVASGKGGVGKSTTAVNLAVALGRGCGLRVGLLDADVYGPSIPTMMKLQGKPENYHPKDILFCLLLTDLKMVPMENYGVKCMSIGFLVDKDAPIVWRGPMVMSAIEKLTRGVAWGELDILVVDMPPGTGDAQLSISQRLQLSGLGLKLIYEDIALLDARRGVNMFRKVKVPILGLVENMSSYKCPHCGQQSHIFGHGGARKTANEMNMEFLGEIPLDLEIRTSSDDGSPVVISPSSVSEAYNSIASRIVKRLQELQQAPQTHPEILL